MSPPVLLIYGDFVGGTCALHTIVDRFSMFRTRLHRLIRKKTLLLQRKIKNDNTNAQNQISEFNTALHDGM